MDKIAHYNLIALNYPLTGYPRPEQCRVRAVLQTTSVGNTWCVISNFKLE